MKPRIKLALGSYDRHGPLLEGAIGHPIFDFEFLEVDPRQGRHERFLQQFEFDACELSFSSSLPGTLSKSVIWESCTTGRSFDQPT
jgi:hypothetical protein